MKPNSNDTKPEKKKKVRRKLNTFRIASFGIGFACVLVVTIIIVFMISSKNTEGRIEANSETSSRVEENLLSEDNRDGNDGMNENESVGITEESIGEKQEETASEDDINENPAEEQKETETEKIVSEWETIPAGTIIKKDLIDDENLNRYFVAYEISDEIYGVILGKSYQANPDVTLSELRYMKILHYNFNHELQVGELIVAKDLVSDFSGIFKELFLAEYEFQSFYLPDKYWTGDPASTDSASIDENNSSCFMYRRATGSGKLSKHALGRAIDINPQQNPYVSYATGSPVWSHENANDYIDRTTGLAHVITEDDICYQIFTRYGFTWGGSWETIKDYQHFQK